jgi:hypothetical protein
LRIILVDRVRHSIAKPEIVIFSQGTALYISGDLLAFSSRYPAPVMDIVSYPRLMSGDVQITDNFTGVHFCPAAILRSETYCWLHVHYDSYCLYDLHYKHDVYMFHHCDYGEKKARMLCDTTVRNNIVPGWY